MSEYSKSPTEENNTLNKIDLFSDFNSTTISEWESKIIKDLKGKDLASINWEHESNFVTKPYFNKENSFKHSENTSGFQNKFIRNDWAINQTILVDEDKKANKNALTALAGGVNSITFKGNINDFSVLLKDIVTTIIEVNYVTNSPLALIKNLKAYCLTIDLDFNALKGSIYFDFTNDWDDLKLCLQETKDSKLNVLTICNEHIQEAGGNTAQQLAIAIAKGNEYLKYISQHNLTKFVTDFTFNIAISNNYFFEISKIRALRILWHNVLNAYKLTDVKLSIHCTTSSVFWDNNDTDNNILRGSASAMSAIIGGCNSLTVIPHNLKNDDFSNRIAKNIQLLLKEESHLDMVIDPSNGSYYIEHITNEIAEKSWTIFQTIESKKGYISALKEGYIKELITEASNYIINRYNNGNITLVGINKYSSSEPKKMILDNSLNSNFGKLVLIDN